MGGWQPLPEDLPPEVRHFVEQLRLLKDRTGLSLVALGARTAYSKSSWHRYLNAGQPPPRQAVVALCRIAGLADPDAERFGVRWELAVQAWPRPATAPTPTAPTAGGDPGDGYEDDPTLPWWDTPPEKPGRSDTPGRTVRGRGGPLLWSALLLLLLTVLIGTVGTVVFG
ncbi:helix-turn-helix domain-containing protein [Streptomyces cellulosae]|uniref:helix-turn-helix domain-containing protein n=1 Tax=Streptomyces cellulosae TaxID=1968 RepID=UPI0004C68A46|nr:helix-turn-helix transcriptional regulator [Streptomyces cellulosae]